MKYKNLPRIAFKRDYLLSSAINITFRTGPKYANFDGDLFVVLNAKGKVEGMGRIFGRWTGQLGSIPVELLAACNDPFNRTHEGVKRTLQTCYPDEYIGDTSVVSCILFTFTPERVNVSDRANAADSVTHTDNAVS